MPNNNDDDFWLKILAMILAFILLVATIFAPQLASCVRHWTY